jgi:hypothetical protein
LIVDSLPLASGLSAAWPRSNSESIAPVYGFGITDELAMDTRPDFSSGRALDRRAATDLFVIGKPVPISQLNPAEKNTACITIHNELFFVLILIDLARLACIRRQR